MDYFERPCTNIKAMYTAATRIVMKTYQSDAGITVGGTTFNAKPSQTRTVRSLSAIANFETENLEPPHGPWRLTSSTFEKSGAPSTSSSKAATFCSHASYQYL